MRLMTCEYEKKVLLAILYAMMKFPNKDFRIWAQGWILGYERDCQGVTALENKLLDELFDFNPYEKIPTRESLFPRDSALWATEAAKALVRKQYDLVEIHSKRAIALATGEGLFNYLVKSPHG